MNIDKDLDLIKKLCTVKGLEKFDIDCSLQEQEEMLFKLARMFVSYDEIIHFDNSLEGAIEFIHWICGQLYTKNDSIYTISQIFKFNKTHSDFTDLYDKFYADMGGREMDKDGLYTTICGQIALIYNLYINGALKLD
jgi:hypothetical protein